MWDLPAFLTPGALGDLSPTGQHDAMFALPAAFAAVPGLARCGCCGGVYLRRRVGELASTPGVLICHDCARSSARMTAGNRR